MDAAASGLAASLTGGLVPAVPVPMRAGGGVDWQAQDAYTAWMAGQQVAGVAAWAHTGRGLHLDLETATRVMESWRKALPAPRRIIAGAGARPRVRRGSNVRQTPPADPLGLTNFVIRSTVEMADEAKRLGADAILAYPPVLLKDLEDADRRIVEVHAALADVGLPVLAFFLYEAAGGITYNERVLDRILALPFVAGIKVATLNSPVTFQDVARRMPPGKLLVSGEDRFLGYSLMMGAKGALVGLGAARTAHCAGLLAAHAKADWPAFHALSEKVDRFGMVTFQEPMDGYVRRMLHVLAHDQVIPADAAHDPFGPAVPDWQLGELDAVLSGL